jgi:hypothetical protein
MLLGGPADFRGTIHVFCPKMKIGLDKFHAVDQNSVHYTIPYIAMQYILSKGQLRTIKKSAFWREDRPRASVKTKHPSKARTAGPSQAQIEWVAEEDP